MIPTLRFGGAEKSLVNLLKLLDPEKLDITLLLFEAGGPLQKEVPDYVHIIEANVLTRAMTLELRYYLKDVLKKGHVFAALSRLFITVRSRFGKRSYFSWKTISKHIPNLLGHYDVAIGYLEGFTDFYVIDKVKADKKIGWIHSDLSKRTILKEELTYYSQFDYLVTISDICKKPLLEHFPQMTNRIFVLENVVVKEDVISQSLKSVDWDNDKIHIITVGRIEWVKGIDLALEAAVKLKESGVQFQWHVFGTGSLNGEISSLIINKQMGDYFLLEGQSNNPYPYMRRADILVQPSRLEGKSLVLDEAKILGKAIVVTNYQSITDQIIDGNTGLIAEIDPGSICEKIIQLINDPILKESLEANAASEINKSILAVDQFYALID